MTTLSTDVQVHQGNIEALVNVPLFSDLSRSELAALAGRFRVDRFRRDDYIFYEGDPAARFWVVKEGQVKIVKYNEGGKEIVIEVIPPGEIFGSAALLMKNQPATARALSDAVTLSLSIQEYKRMLHEYPAVSVRVIEILGERLRGVIGMRMMISERVERRVAHVLLKVASKCGVETDSGWMINVSLSRQEIAELADTTTETAIRVMSRFSKSGWVKTLPGGYVVILDRAVMEKISGESQK